MTRTLKRLQKLIELVSPETGDLTYYEQKTYLHAFWAIGEVRKDLAVLKEGKQKQFVYETLDDLEFRIAEAVEKEIE